VTCDLGAIPGGVVPAGGLAFVVLTDFPQCWADWTSRRVRSAALPRPTED